MAKDDTYDATAEKRPLLGFAKLETFDLTDLRERTAKVEPLTDYTYVERENMTGYVVLRHIAGALGQVTVVLGAYFFLQSTGESIMPRCDLWEKTHLPRYSSERWKEHMCYVTSGCFWTYPIICPLAIIIVYWKNLLDKRLFYECLFNRIFLVQQSTSYLSSPTFWFLFLYFVCGISCIFYIGYGTKRPYDELMFSMLAYISPTIAFVIVLLSNWSVSRLIVSLPMFVERNCPAAMDLLRECKFIRDDEFWTAFCHTEELLANVMRDQRVAFTLNTAELMTLVRDVHETGKKPSRRGVWGQFCGIYKDAYERYFRDYWVSRFLFYDKLNCIRARRFRGWARVYYVFMLVSTVVFLYAMVYTINELCHYYHTDPMYVPMLAPHKIPRALEHASEHMPELMGKLKGKVEVMSLLAESQANITMTAVHKESGVLEHASRVPELMRNLHDELHNLSLLAQSQTNMTLTAVHKVQYELHDLSLLAQTQTNISLSAVRKVPGILEYASTHMPELARKVQDELHSRLSLLAQSQTNITLTAIHNVPRVLEHASEHMPELARKVQDELHNLSLLVQSQANISVPWVVRQLRGAPV